ncbi:MAG: serpin family protein [Deltaproteobacteria bacterium]|nr:serpin family protein [Deltaproteobacteria bacterium]
MFDGVYRRLATICGVEHMGGIVKFNYLLAVAATVASTVCSHSIARSALSDETVQAANQMGIELFNAVEDRSKLGNKFVSPLSVNLALQMLYNGTEGTTKTEFENVLHLSGDRNATNAGNKAMIDLLNSYRATGALDHPFMSGKTLWALEHAAQHGTEAQKKEAEAVKQKAKDEPYGIIIANSFWADENFPVLPSFTKTLATFYSAEGFNRDFRDEKTASDINAWASKNTFGKIKEITDAKTVKTLDNATLNATYFKADWTFEFEKRSTQNLPFTYHEGGRAQKKDVSTMADAGHYALYDKDVSLRAIALPYGQSGDFEMVVILPKAVVPVAQLERMLTADKLRSIQKGLNIVRAPEKRVYTDLHLPKLKMETSLDKLADTLKDSLGMVEAFSDAGGNFSSLTPVGQMSLATAIQKTYLVVNEQGTVAAAVTMIGAVATSAPPQPIPFHVDHPYAFVIQHAKSGLVLFQGTINLPEGGEGA